MVSNGCSEYAIPTDQPYLFWGSQGQLYGNNAMETDVGATKLIRQ